jgi:hypothetical protein
MAGGPLGDHIGDEHPVVFRGEDVGGTGGAGDVGAVHHGSRVRMTSIR